MVDCEIISSLLGLLYDALQHPGPIHTTDHFSQTVGGGERRGESSAAVNVALEQNGKNNMHVTYTKLGNKQIAVHNKLPKPFGDIICMTKHVS